MSDGAPVTSGWFPSGILASSLSGPMRSPFDPRAGTTVSSPAHRERPYGPTCSQYIGAWSAPVVLSRLHPEALASGLKSG